MLTNQGLGTSTFHFFNTLKWQACFYTQVPQTSPCVVSRGSGLITFREGRGSISSTHTLSGEKRGGHCLPNTHTQQRKER